MNDYNNYNGYNYDNSAYNNNYYNDNSYNNLYQQDYYMPADKISNEMYNLIIGGVLLYGFIMNCLMTTFLGDSITQFVYGNPIGFFITYLVMAIAGIFMVKKSDSPVVSFIGYNLIVIPLGMVIASVLTLYGLAGYSTTITYAFAITAGVTFLMMLASSIFPDFFLSLGRTLSVTLLLTIIIELVMVFAHVSLGIIDYIVVLIFCGYVGYDWAKANALPKTVDNAIDSAAELYVDIANLFLRILRILARANKN